MDAATLRLAPRPLAVGSLTSCRARHSVRGRIPPRGLCPWGSTSGALKTQMIVGLSGVVMAAAVIVVGPMRQPRRVFPRALSPVPAVSLRQEALERQAEPASAAQGPASDVAPEDVAYTAHELRDPLESLLPQPLEALSTPLAQSAAPSPMAARPPPTPPALQLQGVVWGGPRPQAIINHHLCRVGDVVEGATVTSIARGRVTLEFQGVAFALADGLAAAGPTAQRLKRSSEIMREPGGR